MNRVRGKDLVPRKPKVDISSGYKICTDCRENKLLEKFTLRKSGRDSGGYSSTCKSCNSNYTKQYRSKYPDKVKETVETRKELTKVTRKIYLEKNSEKVKAVGKLWQQNNLDKVNSKTAKRRSKKLNATPSWTNFKYIELFYNMSKEAELETGNKYHVDHIVPLQSKYVCGLHCEDNLQVLGEFDNISKIIDFGQICQ